MLCDLPNQGNGLVNLVAVDVSIQRIGEVLSL